MVNLSSISSYDDKDLLALLSESNHLAFQEIWGRYWQLIYNTAYKRLKNSNLCQDAVQDIFADLWLRRETLDISNLPAYLNKAIRYKVFKVLADTKADTPFFDIFENMADTAVGADNNVLEKELFDLAALWLESLPEKRRQVFLMRYTEGLSTKEIAQRLSISQKTVQNHLGRATNSLNEQLFVFTVAMLQIHNAAP